MLGKMTTVQGHITFRRVKECRGYALQGAKIVTIQSNAPAASLLDFTLTQTSHHASHATRHAKLVKILQKLLV